MTLHKVRRRCARVAAVVCFRGVVDAPQPADRLDANHHRRQCTRPQRSRQQRRQCLTPQRSRQQRRHATSVKSEMPAVIPGRGATGSARAGTGNAAKTKPATAIANTVRMGSLRFLTAPEVQIIALTAKAASERLVRAREKAPLPEMGGSGRMVPARSARCLLA
jgi:hypothetical protein